MSIINEGTPDNNTPPPANNGTPPPANNTPPPPSVDLNLPQGWQTALPEELREEPSLKLYGDIASMAKSLVHAQKAIGANKIVKPSEHATDEDWKNFFHEIGLPRDPKDYGVKFEDKTGLIKPEFVDKFKEQALKAGVLPKQAQALLDWFVGTNSEQAQALAQQAQQEQATVRESLKKEWGEAYNKNLVAANMVLKEFGQGEEFAKFLDESGFGDNPHVIKFFAKLGNQMFEDQLKGAQSRGGPAITPAEAESKIQQIMGDTKHPYWDRNHPNHRAAVEEMSKLHAAQFPSEQ